MLLAVNRCIRVVRPAIYANSFSKKRSAAMAVCAWILPILSIIVLALATWKQPKSVAVESVTCAQLYLKNFTSNLVYLIMSIINITVPSIVIAACYIKIYQAIRHHNTAAAPSSQGGHSAYGVDESKVTRMLTVVVVGFYLCWLPQLITHVLLALAVIGQTVLKYWTFYYAAPLLASSVLNPMICGTMSQSFINEFLKILRRQP